MDFCGSANFTGGLTRVECTALSSLLNASSAYLEFGAGVSTRLAAMSPSLSRIVTVETDWRYVNKTLAQLGPLSNRVDMRLAPVGKTLLFGYPANPNVTAAHYFSVLGPHETFDLVLVDGRFRVATSARCHRHLLKSNSSRLLVHDFSRRPWYARALMNSSLYRLERQIETLAVFAPVFHKGDTDAAQRMEALHMHDAA